MLPGYVRCLQKYSLQKTTYPIRLLCRKRGEEGGQLQAFCAPLNLSAAVELDLEIRKEHKTSTRFRALKERKRGTTRRKITQVWETPGLALGQPFALPSSALVPLCCLLQTQHPALPKDPPPKALQHIFFNPASGFQPFSMDSSPADLLFIPLHCGLFSIHTHRGSLPKPGRFWLKNAAFLSWLCLCLP